MLIYRGSFSVFSTYVEVILIILLKKLQTISILHVCGGDPDLEPLHIAHQLYSPRMWR